MPAGKGFYDSHIQQTVRVSSEGETMEKQKARVRLQVRVRMKVEMRARVKVESRVKVKV